MDTARLEGLGLQLREDAAGTEAVLDLESSPLVNPVTRAFIPEVTFQVLGDRLIPIAPAAVVGLAPILVGALSDVADIEALLADAFNEHIFHVQRRSAELQVLGLTPRVEPETLELSTEVVDGELAVTLVSDRLGNFRVARVARGKEELGTGSGHTLELSEFRERAALTGYLVALFGEPAAVRRPRRWAQGWCASRTSWRSSARRRWCLLAAAWSCWRSCRWKAVRTASPPRGWRAAPSGGSLRGPRARSGRDGSSWMSFQASCGWWRTC